MTPSDYDKNGHCINNIVLLFILYILYVRLNIFLIRITFLSGMLICDIVLFSVFHASGSFTLLGYCVSIVGSSAAELPPKESEEDFAQPSTRRDTDYGCP